MMTSNIIRVVPLTDEEIKDIQMTVMEKMMHLNIESTEGNINSTQADAEIIRLSKVMEKISKYGFNRHKITA